MSVIPIIITLLAGLMMFVIKRKNKIKILVIGCICLDAFRFINLSFSQFEIFVCLCYFLSELKNYKFYLKNLRQTPFLKIESVALFGVIVTIIFSPHLRSLTSIGGFLVLGYISKYLVIIYSFVGLKSKWQLENYLRITYLCLLILTFFAFLNFILGYPIWLDLFGVSVPTSSSRLRLYGMFEYTFDYGFICIICILIMLYCMNKQILSKQQIFIGIVCSLFGIIMCGSRTVFACGVVGVSIFMLLKNGLVQNIRLIITSVILLLLTISFIPAVQDHLAFVMSAVDSNSDVSGSSAEMRITQYATVLLLISGSPWFGRGYQFFFYDLGWSEGLDVSMLPYPELAGMEGAIMGLLLERGIIGVLVYLIFYLMIIRYAFSLRHNRNDDACISISILITFLCYGNMTGELNSTIPTLLFSGLFLKNAYMKKYKTSENGCIGYHSKLQY